MLEPSAQYLLRDAAGPRVFLLFAAFALFKLCETSPSARQQYVFYPVNLRMASVFVSFHINVASFPRGVLVTALGRRTCGGTEKAEEANAV